MLTPTGRTYHSIHELVSAVTMIGPSTYMALGYAPSALYTYPASMFATCVYVHSFFSMSFHLLLVLAKCSPRKGLLRVSRLAMDLDMTLIYIAGAVASTLHATTWMGIVATFVVFSAAMVIVWTSTLSGPLLHVELMTLRYPLIATSIGIEASLVWLNGDAANAVGIIACFMALSTLAVFDTHLHMWGHPFSHIMLLPGLYFRTSALAHSSSLKRFVYTTMPTA